MAEKTDEEIIKEVGLDNSNDQDEAMDALSLDEDMSNSSSATNEDEFVELIPVSNENSDQANDKESSNENSNVIENEDKDDENSSEKKEQIEEDIPVQKKRPKILKILIGVVIFLFLILIAGVILYFTGFFEPEEPKKMPDKKIEKMVKPEPKFNTKDINAAKLNRKLTALTKTEIMNKEELEAEEKRIQEEERLKKEAEQRKIEEEKKKEEAKLKAELDKIAEEKRLLEEHRMAIKKEQEEFIRLQKEAAEDIKIQKDKFISKLNSDDQMPENDNKNEMIQAEIPDLENNNNEASTKMFLSFINVATIKGVLYKSYLDKALKIDKNVSLCRDFKNRIEIYFGPYDSEKQRNKVLNTLIENGFKQSYLVDFTKDEYQKRCKY